MERQNKNESASMADEIKEQQVKFKNMTFKKKLGYIYDYYKIPILIALIVILIVGSLVRNELTRKTDILYAAIINGNTLTAEVENLENEYYDAYNVNTKKEQVVLDNAMTIKEGINDQVSMASASKLLALFSSNTLDCLICDSFVVDFYSEDGAYVNLEDFLPQDLYQKLKDSNLIYETKDENGQTVPTGIDMTNCEKLIQNKLYAANQPIYMVFTRNCPHKEEAKNFFDLLFEK